MITIYTRNNCKRCEEVKHYMDGAKIEYGSENIEENQQALKLARQVGGMGFPFVVFETGEFLAGATEPIIEKLSGLIKSDSQESSEVNVDGKPQYFWGK